MNMLDSRSGGTSDFGGEQPQGGYSRPAAQAQQPAQQSSPGTMPPPPNYDDFDDDIPF
jgi:single-strand DNA-binding protein